MEKKSYDKQKENIAKTKAAMQKVNVTYKNTKAYAHAIRDKTGHLKVVKAAKKDAASAKKSYQQIQSAISEFSRAGVKTLNPKESESTNQGVSAGAAVAYMDTATAVAKAYVKGEAIVGKRLIQGAYYTTKTGAKISIKVARKLKEIHLLNKNMKLMNIMSSVNSPGIKKSSPKIKNCTLPKPQNKTGAAQKYVSNNSLKRSEKPMRRKKPNQRKIPEHTKDARKEQKIVAGQQQKQPITIGKAKIYDVSKLEKIYGIHGKSANTYASGIHGAGEEVRGVHARGTEKQKPDHTPKQIKEPSKSERVKSAEKNQGVRSKNAKDNVAEKPNKQKKKPNTKKKAKSGNKGSVAKREAKRYVMEQLLLNEGNENCSSGVGAMVGNILTGKTKELIGKAFSGLANSAKKMALKLLKWLVMAILFIIKTILKYLLLALAALIGPVGITILVVVVGVFGGVFMIAGFFLSFIDSGEFAVKYINNYCNEIVELSESYDEVNYYPYGGQYANYDDIMLVYLSKVADIEDDADLDGDAPFMWINKRAEEKAIKEATESMYTYTTEERTEIRLVPIVVTCTPTPTPTASPAPSTSPTPTPTASPTPSTSPTSEPPVSPTPTPTPEPEYIIIYEEQEVTITVFNIYMKSAEQYMSAVTKKQVLENYEVLNEVYKELGYSPYGGTTVCDYYGIDYKSTD